MYFVSPSKALKEITFDQQTLLIELSPKLFAYCVHILFFTQDSLFYDVNYTEQKILDSWAKIPGHSLWTS